MPSDVTYSIHRFVSSLFKELVVSSETVIERKTSRNPQDIATYQYLIHWLEVREGQVNFTSFANCQPPDHEFLKCFQGRWIPGVNQSHDHSSTSSLSAEIWRGMPDDRNSRYQRHPSFNEVLAHYESLSSERQDEYLVTKDFRYEKERQVWCVGCDHVEWPETEQKSGLSIRLEPFGDRAVSA